MNATKYPTNTVNLTVRKNLDFALTNMPRYWLNNDPFLTRVFDALSLTFPVGERYFISSIRAYRDLITNPDLQQKVADFIMQEAQHGIAHEEMNTMLTNQGMPIAEMVSYMKKFFQRLLDNRSNEFNIAHTAAAEHLTALMAECFFGKKDTLAKADPYVRAMFAWHAIEEMEHRDVAFDVMQQVAQVSYATRVFALLQVSLTMSIYTLIRANIMLKADDFSLSQRATMFATGIPWLFGKKGKLTAMKGQYLDWFKRDFHPSQHPILQQYAVWVDTLERTKNPITAGNALWEAGQ